LDFIVGPVKLMEMDLKGNHKTAGFQGRLSGPLKWLIEQSGFIPVIVTMIIGSAYTWASHRVAPIVGYATEHPWIALSLFILLAFSLYGIYEASMKVIRRIRRPDPDGPISATSTVLPTSPNPLPPGTDFKSYIRDRFPLRIGVDSGLYYGLGCRWEWEEDRIVRPAILCPDCWDVPTVEFTPRILQGTTVSCNACGFRGNHADDPQRVIAELARLAREKARDGGWRKVVANQLDSNGNAP
jgi:hypothetical protein